VTNITGKAQLECAEMNVSVGCTIDSMVLYIGAEPRHDPSERSAARTAQPRGFSAKSPGEE
jgi:hypothetical protein